MSALAILFNFMYQTFATMGVIKTTYIIEGFNECISGTIVPYGGAVVNNSLNHKENEIFYTYQILCVTFYSICTLFFIVLLLLRYSVIINREDDDERNDTFYKMNSRFNMCYYIMFNMFLIPIFILYKITKFTNFSCRTTNRFQNYFFDSNEINDLLDNNITNWVLFGLSNVELLLMICIAKMDNRNTCEDYFGLVISNCFKQDWIEMLCFDRESDSDCDLDDMPKFIVIENNSKKDKDNDTNNSQIILPAAIPFGFRNP